MSVLVTLMSYASRSTILQVILQGSVESGLPEEYFNKLMKFPHNGSNGGPKVPIEIEYKYTKPLN